jgi:class 3 adenylate cyclase
VEDSTAYWDEYGDLDGRLMIDLHNRLISPVIKRYRGKIVKHIGDSIMASFKSPRNALQASIAIQQILEKRRSEDAAFRLRVRIGIHAGKALVEGDDIFGDAVNLAARVQGLAKGNEIYVSSSTASLFQKEVLLLFSWCKLIRGSNKLYDSNMLHMGYLKSNGYVNYTALFI